MGLTVKHQRPAEQANIAHHGGLSIVLKKHHHPGRHSLEKTNVIAEKSEGATTPAGPKIANKQVPWLRLAFSLFLSLLGIWFVTRDVNLADVRVALAQAQLQYVLLGLATMVLTMVMKAWRWQLMFSPGEQAPSFRHVFWSLALGQLVNTAVPFLRLGELARVYDLGVRAEQSRARAFGTLLVEKVLDLIMIVLTLALLIPFLVIPNFVGQSGVIMATAGILALLALITLALRSDVALRAARFATSPLPEALRVRAFAIVVAGLEGLAALRSARAIFVLLLASSAIAILSILTPWILFPALDISLGLVAAAAIHVVLTLGTLPPSTPARVGVFEFLVAFMLRFFDIENSAVILTYTIIFHLVVVIPQLILGGVAALHRNRPEYA